MEDDLANLNHEDEEEEAFREDPKDIDLQFYLEGTYLMKSTVYFPSLRNTMPDLWHPIRGIMISDLGERRFIFKFFLAVDIKRVMDGMSWLFNNHLLFLKEVNPFDDPLTTVNNHIIFWIQIHDLPSGLMLKIMVRRFGSFLGKFLEYDTKSFSWGFQCFIRFQIRLNINLPLKQRKKI